jgi:putative oxidoreductase
MNKTQILTVLGRFLYSSLFISAGLGHFSAATIGYAASQGVPLAGIAVPLSGVMAIVGGLSVLLGYKARYGALILIAFLIPVTVMMHAFWGVSDPMQRQIQMVMFMKNTALVGSTLLVYIFGSGPASLESRVQPRLAKAA